MSYRIAFVRFTKSGQTYPVNCHRKDLEKGDIVVVEMSQEQNHKLAQLDRIEFLNWNCANTILCKRSEYQRGADGRHVVVRVRPKGDAVETLGELGGALQCMGWDRFRPTSSVWRTAFARSRPKLSGVIAFRKNGIDFQVFDGSEIPAIVGQKMAISVGDGRCFVRNWYYDSGTDLYDLTLSFAKEIERDQPILEPYLHGIGQKPPRPKHVEGLDDSAALAQWVWD
jgi:hypothetical protein